MQTLHISEVNVDDEQVDSSHRLIGRKANDTSPSPAVVSGWLDRALNSTVCCLCLLLLSPAIVAVWIAIRRSTQPLNMSMAKSAPATHSDDELPVSFVLKPERMRIAESSHIGSRANSLAEPLLAAQAAV